MKFEPMVKGAYGRFFFKPSTAGPAALYAGQSQFIYNFGNQAFGDGPICQVMKPGSDGKPSKTYSSELSQCTIEGATIRLTVG
jgi:hypothetical protein